MTGTAAPRTVLLVDDDKELIRFLTERLETEGWRVLSEKDGEWAVRAFERRPFDAIVLDILIPGMSGFQVAERVRALPRGAGVGILMLTGIYRGPRHRQEAIERYGLLDYLVKPIDAEQVVTLLRRHFETAEPHEVSAPPMDDLPDTVQDGQAYVPAEHDRLVDEAQRREQQEVEQAASRIAQGTPTPPPDRPSAGVRKGTPVGEVLRGNLRQTPFPELLAQLYRRRVTGAVFLLRERVKKIVYLQDGHPTYIKSNMLDECLGRVLVRERMISERECEESVRRMKTERRQQGSILIQMGIISPHNLRFALELQLQIKLFDIFAWPEGEYVVRVDVPLPDDAIVLEMSNGQIIFEGVRRSFTEERLAEALAPVLDRYLERTAEPDLRFQDLGLPPGALALAESLDGTRTTIALIGQLGQDRRDAMALVYALQATGVTTARATPAAPAPRPAAADGVVPLAEPAAVDEWDDARLAAFLAERRSEDPCTILGVPRAASDDEIEGAFAALARGLHADRFRGKPESTRTLAREAFELVVFARRQLEDPERRRALALDDEAVDGPGDPAARALAADHAFQHGLKRLGGHMFGEAEKLFRQAVDLRPDVGRYHAYLGWATFCARGQAAGAAAEAQACLLRAAELSPALEEPHLFLGMVHNATDRPDLAEPEFEKAVQCNPDSADALRELRLLHLRRQ